jgi:hypothetical protein
LSSSVSNTPADLSFPSIGDFTFNFSDDQTSLVLGGLKNSDGNDYSGDVVISAPVILDYSIEEHEEQRVVRKAMNFNDNVFSTVEETIPEDSLSFCDSNGDGKLDGSDKIFLSKQFLRAIVSVKMNGDDLTQKFKQRDAVTQGRSSNRGSESSLDNRVERAFIQLEPNEDIVITGPLVVKYRHYNTDTYADGSVNDGEIVIANSFAANAGADAAQNPTFDDIAKSPYILSQSIEYGGKGYQHLDFRGYEYVTDAGDRVGSDNSTSPQSEFNRAFTFGKDKAGGFMPVDVQGEAGVEYTAEFYNHVPLTLYLDEDRKLKLFTGTPALLLDDGFAELKSTQMRIADIRQYGYGTNFNESLKTNSLIDLMLWSPKHLHKQKLNLETSLLSITAHSLIHLKIGTLLGLRKMHNSTRQSIFSMSRLDQTSLTSTHQLKTVASPARMTSFLPMIIFIFPLARP